MHIEIVLEIVLIVSIYISPKRTNIHFCHGLQGCHRFLILLVGETVGICSMLDPGSCALPTSNSMAS